MEKYIDKIFYINLDKRTDRRIQIEAELERMDLSGERFEAIYNSRGALGCTLSHLEVIKIAKQRVYNNILILEDDFEFLLTKEEFKKIMTEFFESSLSYDIVMLAYNGRSDPSFNNGIVSRVKNAGTTAGYIVHNKLYDKLIENYETSYTNLLKTNYYNDWAIDKYWYYLLKDREWYLFNNRIGKQRESFSDIEKKVVNYGV